MTALAPPVPSGLRRLYAVRAVAALVWAGLLLPVADATGPWLTVLLVAYPLLDAAAVLWQARTTDDVPGAHATEWLNVALSAVVAVALGVASTRSLAAALVVWGVWAVGAGAAQLVTAWRRRRTGGQVPQVLSGGLSVLAGGAFVAQGSGAPDSIAGIGGYAVLGGLFFLASAARLTVLARRTA